MFEEPETVAKWTDECYWVKHVYHFTQKSGKTLIVYRVHYVHMLFKSGPIHVLAIRCFLKKNLNHDANV